MLATPLVVMIGVLVLMLSYFSWLAANHAPAHIPPAAPDFILWLTLGLAGLFMPLLTRLQRVRLDEIKNLKAVLSDFASSLREAVKRSTGTSASCLAADLARGMTSFLSLPPPTKTGVQHVCLTPRILAQRPSYPRVPRG